MGHGRWSLLAGHPEIVGDHRFELVMITLSVPTECSISITTKAFTWLYPTQQLSLRLVGSDDVCNLHDFSNKQGDPQGDTWTFSVPRVSHLGVSCAHKPEVLLLQLCMMPTTMARKNKPFV